jgi:hypothetical protein
MLKFKEFLIEKTFNVNKDTDWIMQTSGMKHFLRLIESENVQDIQEFVQQNVDYKGEVNLLATDSSFLKSRDSKKAHKKKPINIRVGMYQDGSFYNPVDKQLQISLNYHAFTTFSNLDFSKDKARNDGMLNAQATRFLHEFDYKSVAATVQHELTHYLDDALHNDMIQKVVNRAKEGKVGLKGSKADVNHTEFEINSQIHAMKQLKRDMGKKKYDALNFKTLFQNKASIMSNFKNFRNEDEYTKMVKAFVSRLHREKLLPKGLQRIPDWRQMQNLLGSV